MSSIICTPVEVPILVAPTFIMAKAVFRFLIPPAALIPIFDPTVFRMRDTSSTVAPDNPPNPVDVLTKSAPAYLAITQALIFSSSVRRAVSNITLTILSPADSTTP